MGKVPRPDENNDNNITSSVTPRILHMLDGWIMIIKEEIPFYALSISFFQIL